MRITLFGFYNYDPTLFDDVTLPEGIEKDYMINEIIKRSGDLFPYHQALPYLKTNITMWFNRNYSQFEKMINALLLDYVANENYDRIESSTDVRDITATPRVSVTNETQVSAFDTAGYSPSEKNTSSQTGSDTSKDTFTHNSRMHGNIGVTTNAQMINEEIELRKFDIYTDIARRFEKEFLIQVY